jgi:hypothetical protein
MAGRIKVWRFHSSCLVRHTDWERFTDFSRITVFPSTGPSVQRELDFQQSSCQKLKSCKINFHYFIQNKEEKQIGRKERGQARIAHSVKWQGYGTNGWENEDFQIWCRQALCLEPCKMPRHRHLFCNAWTCIYVSAMFCWSYVIPKCVCVCQACGYHNTHQHL